MFDCRCCCSQLTRLGKELPHRCLRLISNLLEGPGGAGQRAFPREIGPGLFQRCSQGGSDARGTGLGLDLWRLISPAHGGRISASDCPGRDARFVVQLPDKERALAQVELALTSLMAGASWWDQKATAALQRSDPHQAIAAANQGERLDGLTQREREVLACLANGDNNRVIAQRLGIGEGTVRSHVHVLLQKLQVHNRTQAALIWLTAEEHDRRGTGDAYHPQQGGFELRQASLGRPRRKDATNLGR